MATQEQEHLGLQDKVRLIHNLYAQLEGLLKPTNCETHEDKAKMARHRIRLRRSRDHYFPSNLFADPAWDMLLDLYAAHHEGRPVSVSSLCIASAVPATTALRYIATMVNDGYFIREMDGDDGRRIFIRLTANAFESLEAYFQEAADMSTRYGQ